MTHEQELQIVFKVIDAGQRIMKSISSGKLLPFELLQQFDEAESAFEDALEIVDQEHPVKQQLQEQIEKIRHFRKKLQMNI